MAFLCDLQYTHIRALGILQETEIVPVPVTKKRKAEQDLKKELKQELKEESIDEFVPEASAAVQVLAAQITALEVRGALYLRFFVLTYSVC